MAVKLGSEPWNFNVLLGGGAASKIADQIAGPGLVLPFLYLALGAPIMFAGLLLPVVQVSRMISQIVSVPFISASSLRKWYLTLGSFAMIASLAIVAVAAERVSSEWLAVAFLLSAAIVGVGQGVNDLAFQDVLGRVLPAHRRSTLLYTTVSLAGLLAMVVAWGNQHIFSAATALKGHIALVWTGIAIYAIYSILTVIIREPPDAPKPAVAAADKKGYVAELCEGFSRVGKVPWFRRYLIERTLCLSILLAMPFYAVHAASLHHAKAGSLGALVLATGAGMIVAGPLWRRVGQVSPQSGMALGALIAAAGGVLALTIELQPRLQMPVVHALVFFLVSIAYQGVKNALSIYLIELAPTAERAYFLAVASTVSGGVGVVAAFALGAIAHIQHVAWPLYCLIGLNLLTCIYSFRLAPIPKTVNA